MDRVIITAAITGSRITRETAPNIPVSPDEIAQSAIECWEAGASIVHIHVRDPQTGLGSQDLELFRQVVGRAEARDRSYPEPYHERDPRKEPADRGEACAPRVEPRTGVLRCGIH